MEESTAPSNPWPVISHLSPLISFLIPMSHLIAPLAIWLWRRKKDPRTEPHAREAFNFQLSMTLYLFVAGFLLVVAFAWVQFQIREGTMAREDALASLIPVLAFMPILFVFLANIALMVRSAVRDGKRLEVRYPLTFRLLGQG